MVRNTDHICHVHNADFCAVGYGEQVNPLATVSEFLFRE